MIYKEDAEYNVSFFCCYEKNLSKHSQTMKLSDIPMWMGAYHFTHPDVKSISAKVWFDKE